MRRRTPISILVDFTAGRLPPEEALYVLDQIEQNSEDSAIVETSIGLLELSKVDGRKLFGDSCQAPLTRWQLAMQRLKQRWAGTRLPWRVAGAIAGAALFLLTLLIRIYPPSGSLTNEVAISEEDLHFLVRGGRTTEVEWASHLISTGHVVDAIEVLEWYIRAFNSSPDIPIGHFLAGVSWMCRSRQAVLGVYYSVDEESVRKALGHFDLIEPSSPITPLNLEVKWYKARAYLMIGEKRKAVVLLESLCSVECSHAESARRLLYLALK